MTVAHGPAHPGSGWTLMAVRRAVNVLRHFQEENVRASEAIFRPIGAPRSHPRVAVPAGSPGHAASTTERAERVS